MAEQGIWFGFSRERASAPATPGQQGEGMASRTGCRGEAPTVTLFLASWPAPVFVLGR